MSIRRAARTALRAILVAVPVLGSCGDSTSTGPGIDFYAARSRWEKGHPAAYAYTLQRSCFCGSPSTSPVVIDVVGGVVQSRRYAETGMVVDVRLADDFPPIDGLFEIIETAAQDGAARLVATYDPALGFPTRIEIDSRENVADDEVTYDIRGFAGR
jgi:hypothetical protein